MKRKQDRSVLSINQLAELVGMDRGRASRLLREASLKPARETDHVTLFVPREALPILYGKDATNAQAERAKLDAARSEMVKLQLAERRGELIPLADVEALGAAVMAGVQQRVLGLRTIVAELRAADTDAEAADLFDAAARDALSNLARLADVPGELQREDAAARASVRDDHEAAERDAGS
jgi:hypothetical protein